MSMTQSPFRKVPLCRSRHHHLLPPHAAPPAHHSIDHALGSHPTFPCLLWQPRSADSFLVSPLPVVAWEGGKEIPGGRGGLLEKKVDELSIRMLTYLDDAGNERCMAPTSLRCPGAPSAVEGFKMLNELEITEHIAAGQIPAGGYLAQLLGQPRRERPWFRGSLERLACPSLKA